MKNAAGTCKHQSKGDGQLRSAGEAGLKRASRGLETGPLASESAVFLSVP